MEEKREFVDAEIAARLGISTTDVPAEPATPASVNSIGIAFLKLIIRMAHI